MASQVIKAAASTMRCGVSYSSSRSFGSISGGSLLHHCTVRPSMWGVCSVAVRHMSSVQQQFEDAKQRLTTLKEDPGSETKLKMYALFKQGTTGKVTSKRPGMVDFVGRAKWDAWSSLADMTQEDAMKAYVAVVDDLVAEEAPQSSGGAESGQKYETLLVTVEDGLRTITLNRPNKKNAITSKMYVEWIAALEEAAADPATVITVVTGSGDYYCSGNDLSNFATIPEEGPQKLAKDSKEMIYKYVDAFIEFPKPLVAVVNGPAIGVSVTTMALYDAAYCTDKAWFQTPFTTLGQSAEGCASYVFPRIMGPGLATEMLMFNKKMTADEAQRAGLVTEVFPDARFQAEVWPKLQQLAKLPKQSLVYSKALVRNQEKERLKQANHDECERLEERWLSDECRDAIMAFFSRKK